MAGFGIRSAGMFLFWILASFPCYYFTKYYLERYPDVKIKGVIIVSSCQLILCFVVIKLDMPERSDVIAAKSEVIATIATNAGLLMNTYLTLTFKMLEPVSTALIQRITTFTHISAKHALSLALIVIGAVSVTGSHGKHKDFSFTLGFALMSNCALAVRNITMKTAFENERRLVTRPLPVIFSGVVSLLGICILVIYMGNDVILVAAVVASALSRVANSYFSVAMVLNHFSVQTHAVLVVFKRISVVLMLCSLGIWSVSYPNIIGLLFAWFGLAVYVHGKRNASPKLKDPMDDVNKRLSLCLALCVSTIAFGMLTFHGAGMLLNNTVNNALIDAKEITFVSTKENSADYGNTYTHVNGSITGYPFETNSLIVSQKTNHDVITETQNLHFRLFNHLIGQYPHIVLVDLAAHENKGDSAIGVGEVLLLRRLKKEVIFYCRSRLCVRQELKKARDKALKLGRDKVAVLSHGGGNIASYPEHDEIRQMTFEVFVDFKIIIFPQSLWLVNSLKMRRAEKVLSKHRNVSLLMRDAQSLKRARQHFQKNHLILAPDMAFQIGSVPRSMSPQYDVIWLVRSDGESKRYKTTGLNTHGLTVKAEDWLQWMPSTDVENTMEKINTGCEMGVSFLERGRVAITDRLHGHILATLMHMPHVLLDTTDRKLASYHNTWTKGLEGGTILTATSPQDAMDKAKQLLEKFDDHIPRVASYMSLKDGQI